MRMMKITSVLLAGFILSIATHRTVLASESDAISACKAAEEARKEAAKVKMEWTTTSKLIRKGKKAIKNGDYEKAIKACSEAKLQGEISVQQAAQEAQNWKNRVPQ